MNTTFSLIIFDNPFNLLIIIKNNSVPLFACENPKTK